MESRIGELSPLELSGPEDPEEDDSGSVDVSGSSLQGTPERTSGDRTQETTADNCTSEEPEKELAFLREELSDRSDELEKTQEDLKALKDVFAKQRLSAREETAKLREELEAAHNANRQLRAVVARGKPSRLSDQSRTGRPESPKNLQAEIEYYRLKVDELQLTLELEEHNRTQAEARRRKTLERDDADVTEKAMEGYRATVQYLYGLLLESQSEVSVLQGKLREEQARRGTEGSVTGREAEQVIDMLTLERQRRQVEIERLEGDLKGARSALMEAEEVSEERRGTIEAYEELVAEKEQEIEQLLGTVKEVMGRAQAAAESAKLWRGRALEIATEAVDSVAAESVSREGHREPPLLAAAELTEAAHCTAVERLAVERVIDEMSITPEQGTALSFLKALNFLQRVLRKATVTSLSLARCLCGTPRPQDSQAAHLCSLLTRTADAAAATLGKLTEQSVEKCISAASSKGVTDLMLSAEAELDDVVRHIAVMSSADLSPCEDLVLPAQNFLTKLQSACSAMLPDFNPSAAAGVAGSAVLAARMVAVAAAASVVGYDGETEALVEACGSRIRQALDGGSCGKLLRPAAVEDKEQAYIRALEKTVFTARVEGETRHGGAGLKGISEGLEAATLLIGRMHPEGELPEVTPSGVDGSIEASVIDVLHRESGRYVELQRKLEEVQGEAGVLRKELQASCGDSESLRATLAALEGRLLQTAQKDEAAKARDLELERLRAEIEYYRRVERRQLRAQLGSSQKELDAAGSKEAALRRRIQQFEEAERLRSERERATGDFGGGGHLLALQMQTLSQQNARLRVRLVRACMRPFLPESTLSQVVTN